MRPIDSCHPKYVLSRSQILSLETRHMLITLQLVMETNMNYALLKSYSIQNKSSQVLVAASLYNLPFRDIVDNTLLVVLQPSGMERVQACDTPCILSLAGLLNILLAGWLAGLLKSWMAGLLNSWLPGLVNSWLAGSLAD